MAALVSNTLLPSNATPQERALEGATERISDVPVLVRESKDPIVCQPALLPWLAFEYSVDIWESNWTDEQKRETIRESVYVHQHKGTIGAVKRALAALGYDVTIQEWFNQLPAGSPYTFDVLLDSNQVGIDQDALTKILAYIEVTKNLRSHRGRVRPSVTTRAGPVIGGAQFIGNDITVKYQPPPGSPLMLDGAWWMDGTQNLDGAFN